ncbi:hypothetical protein NUW58_g1815 [Xylaria curta]|uniref:Uncharacterized protein n=1 Tax=Xylaria curta TaxID=42375 RepID=A0ACC1PIM1_9PEZI|nr:hypothetical protein NUW58_g1815 [Xylaria curta]
MDPLSALSVAAGVIQFVDFAFRLVSGTRAIVKSKSGLTSYANTLDAIARDAAALSDALAVSPALASTNPTMQALVSECRAIADSLLVVLGKLRTDKTKKWSCFVAALRTVWSKTKIEEFVSLLGKVQNQISTHTHFILLNYMNMQSVQINALKENGLRLGVESQSQVESLRDTVIGRLEILSKETQKAREDMKQFIESLESNKPTAACPTHLGLSVDLTNYFSGVIKQLVEEQSLMSLNQDFLESLYFSKIKARLRKIESAHSKTFQWIFQSPVPDGSKTISFAQWLHEGAGTFWIQGKAGSGKSTLMKFVCSHPTTIELLQQWADGKRLVTAGFFFWNAGTLLQKSREGLLRSLLFEILRKCPELIPRVSKSNQRVPFRRRHAEDEELWSQEELMEAYRSLVACCDEIDVKFCFFIDGLDEFEEDNKTHSDLIATLRILAASENIKFCVSSRPWTVFSDAFGEDPDRLLRLEDLTRDDIRSYVHENFNENSQFRLLSTDNPDYADLVEDITRQAQGVFLWVFLVVRDLLEGFSHSDTIHTLRKRLERFPAELEQFFQHMIDSIPAIYLPHMARTLWMATSVSEPQFLMVYSLLDDVSESMATFAEARSPDVMYNHEVRTRAQQMRRRLDGRCKGLLEVVLDEPDAGLYFEYKVDFLHRTVRDFLLGSPKIRRILEQQRFAELSGISSRSSSVWLLPCLSILEAFKRAPFRNRRPGDASSALRLLESFMMFAQEAEANMSDLSALIRMLHDAEKTYDRRRWQFSWPLDTNLFLGLACQANLFDYIEARIHPGFFTQPSDSVSSTAKFSRAEPTRTLLSYALELQTRKRLGWTLHPRIVKHLLSVGASPNDPDKNQEGPKVSTWQTFLMDTSLSMRLSSDEQFREILQMLVKHGADVKPKLTLKSGRLTTAQKLVEGILGREIEEFQALPLEDEGEPIPFELEKSVYETWGITWLVSWWNR